MLQRKQGRSEEQSVPHAGGCHDGQVQSIEEAVRIRVSMGANPQPVLVFQHQQGPRASEDQLGYGHRDPEGDKYQFRVASAPSQCVITSTSTSSWLQARQQATASAWSECHWPWIIMCSEAHAAPQAAPGNVQYDLLVFLGLGEPLQEGQVAEPWNHEAVHDGDNQLHAHVHTQ